MWKGATRKSRRELPKNNDGVSTDSTSSIELDAATVECE
jgi:hypothetical protein